MGKRAQLTLLKGYWVTHGTPGRTEERGYLAEWHPKSRSPWLHRRWPPERLLTLDATVTPAKWNPHRASLQNPCVAWLSLINRAQSLCLYPCYWLGREGRLWGATLGRYYLWCWKFSKHSKWAQSIVSLAQRCWDVGTDRQLTWQ